MINAFPKILDYILYHPTAFISSEMSPFPANKHNAEYFKKYFTGSGVVVQ